MGKNNDNIASVSQRKTAINKQVKLNVDGYVVKLNFLSMASESTKISALKKMIINGLAKA